MPRSLGLAGGSSTRRTRFLTERVPGVLGVDEDGLLRRRDGSLVRYLKVSPVNPLVMGPQEAERVSGGFAQIAARLADGQALQLYTTASRIDPGQLLATSSFAVDGTQLGAACRDRLRPVRDP